MYNYWFFDVGFNLLMDWLVFKGIDYIVVRCRV